MNWPLERDSKAHILSISPSSEQIQTKCQLFESLYGVQFKLSTQLIKTTYQGFIFCFALANAIVSKKLASLCDSSVTHTHMPCYISHELHNNNIIHLYSVFSQWSKDASQIEGKL